MKNAGRGNKLLPRWLICGVLFILSFLIFNPGAKAAVTGKIAGVVLDARTGEPLPGANIIIEGTDRGTAADVDGSYYILNLQPGTYNVQARMMGYESVTQTGVDISADHTTRLRFELEPTVIEGEGITVRATSELIKMDLSASYISAKGEDIKAVPFVSELGDFINQQAGVQRWIVRGGSIDETSFMADGLSLVDGRTNEPILLPNLSMVKELNIIKGGFNAEYDNVRSGLINIITKDPSETYHGSVTFERSPAHYKHFGPSIYDPENWYLKSYLYEGDVDGDGKSDSVWYYGTRILPDSIEDQWKAFTGWNYWETRNRPYTAEQGRAKFMWQHRVEGSDSLVPADYHGPARENPYGDKPDWNADFGFGGPIPVIGGFLGDLGFYVSYRQNREAWALPLSDYSDYYIEKNAFIKLTSHPTKSIKLNFEFMSGEQNTLAQVVNGDISENTGDFNLGQFVDFNDIAGGVGGYYLWNGDAAFDTDVALQLEHTYYGSGLAPYGVYHNMTGLTFDHALTSNTFYTLRITYLTNERQCRALELLTPRDTTIYLMFPDSATRGDSICYLRLTEEPYGYDILHGPTFMVGDNAAMGAHCAGQFDTSTSATRNVKFDFTSQINRFNQIKFGLLYNFDDLNTYYERNRWESPGEEWVVSWKANPIRGGAYIQDKIEFEGVIANVGVRADYFNPNIDWFDVNPYSYFFSLLGKVNLDQAPTSPAKGQLKLSPRLGISHPISENAKLYFNYGDFYSLPTSYDLYQVFPGSPRTGILFLGNPELKMARTTAYELGTDISIADMFRLHIAGYYKDVKDEANTVRYEDIDGVVGYGSRLNNGYRDIRGFEIRFAKEFGDWIRGWINYDYRVTSSGRSGRDIYYEDPLLQETEGEADPTQDKPLPRPVMNAGISFLTPERLGPVLGDLDVSFLYSWEDGYYVTDEQAFGEDIILQWAPWKKIQVKIQKTLNIAGTSIYVYGQVDNLMNWKYMNDDGFSDDEDRDSYYMSLHLPLYGTGRYADDPLYTAGNDRLGDVKSDDKPYIDDPNIEHLAFRNPRSFSFGVGFDF
jgi:hypothetical protein